MGCCGASNTISGPRSSISLSRESRRSSWSQTPQQFSMVKPSCCRVCMRLFNVAVKSLWALLKHCSRSRASSGEFISRRRGRCCSQGPCYQWYRQLLCQWVKDVELDGSVGNRSNNGSSQVWAELRLFKTSRATLTVTLERQWFKAWKPAEVAILIVRVILLRFCPSVKTLRKKFIVLVASSYRCLRPATKGENLNI